MSRPRAKLPFGRVIRSGKRLTTVSIEARYCVNDGEPARLGVFASSRLLKRAVVRNAFKRQVRQLFRCYSEDLKGLDVIIRPRVELVQHPRHYRDQIARLFQSLCRERLLS